MILNSDSSDFDEVRCRAIHNDATGRQVGRKVNSNDGQPSGSYQQS